MIDFDLISGIGWRDVILVVAAMAGVYLVLSVMRLFQVRGGRRGAAASAGSSPSSGPEPGVYPQAEPVRNEPFAETEFARELARTSVEAELDRLRRECAQLRQELARVGEEVTRLKATRNVSPLYNEATALAQQGMPAAGIAGHCGISIGEAELVAALARSGSEFGRKQQGEDRDERYTGT